MKKFDLSKAIYIILMMVVFGLSSAFGQNSYVVIEAQYDSFGPAEAQFYIVTNSTGDTVYHHQPTQPDEYLLDTLYLDAQALEAILLDSYGDGWQDSGTQGYFRVSNHCQDTIAEFLCSPSNFFATEIISFNVGPCLPNGPPPPIPCVPATVIINLDQYQSETSWEISNASGTIFASGGTGGSYNIQPDYGTVIVPVCIPADSLIFTIYDSYGDGMQGSVWQGQDGSYFVKQCNDTLVYGTDPAFGSDSSHVFLSDTCPPILGCTDNDYIEWNPFATVDDGSCQTLKIFGCTDSTMYNYDPNANTMELIDTCTFTLTLHDLMGNGWIGSNLELILPDTSYTFTHTGGFNQTYSVGMTAPDPAVLKFNITPQASLTTIECGFTLVNPEGDTLISVQPPFIQPLFPYTVITNCGNTCIPKVFGCIDTLAVNYDSIANTNDGSCYYSPGCMNSSYLEYYTQGFTADYDDGTCVTLAVWGCTDTTAFNYDSLANIDNGGCIPEILGCTQPLAFNFNPLANTDDGSCVPFIYGCTDQSMFNYDSLANTDDGSCIPYIYGCTDSTMFNFNPLSNAEYTPSNCIPFIYGCTDPSMLNYNPLANEEDFSCIPYIYGCTDPTALNYDSTANTNNGSCITVVEGCMDQNAWNYNSLANVSDSTSCLYAANCIGDPGDPYWLNDPCYAWVIDVDNYCCNTEWDLSCQNLYNYCDLGWTGTTGIAITEANNYITIYPNPTKGQVNFSTFVDIELYTILGSKVLDKENINRVDLSMYDNGIYNLIIKIDNKRFNFKIVKQ